MFFSGLMPKVPAPPTSDPYSLTPPVPNVVGGATCATFPDWDNPNGRVEVDPATLTGKTLGLIWAGQSLATSCVNGTYTPTHVGRVLNFSMTNGQLYQSKDPLLGCTGYHPNLPGNPWPTGHPANRLGDRMINAGTCDNIWFGTMGVGGSNILDWQDPSLGGGGNNHRFGVMARRLAARNLRPDGLIFQQGTSNNNGTTQAQYFAAGSSMIGTIRGLWPTMPIFMCLESMAGNGMTSSAVRAAQAQLVDHSNGVWLGADTDSLDSSYRQMDLLHWNNATGSDAVAALHQAALHAYGF
jgi:hypothetical protein